MAITQRHDISHLLSIFILAIPALATSAPPCADLTPQKGELGYQQRGERCEGIFVQDIRSHVRLKSVFVPLDPVTPAAENDLRLALPADTPSSQHQIRVSSLDPRVHYQLDAIVSDKQIFTWPKADVINKLSIEPSDLAPLSWSVSEPAYYVPVSAPSALASTQNSSTTDVHVIIESRIPIQDYAAKLISKKSGLPKRLTASSALPTTQLGFVLPPRDSSGQYTLWLRVRLLGESQPEGHSWTLWLP
jgi:hypothetical protein